MDQTKEGEVARKRGGRSADDEFDEDVAVDADLDDVDDLDDLDDVDDEPDRDTGRRPARATSRSATARTRTAARTKTKEEKRPGLFGRIWLFVREVVAEMQKVIWPTRKELLTYTTVVVVFVAIMMTYVALADYGLARLMFLVFGTDNSAANS
jgi:preprotein translocase subunit SecE